MLLEFFFGLCVSSDGDDSVGDGVASNDVDGDEDGRC